MICFAERGVIGSQRPGDFLLVCDFFVGMTFHTENKSTIRFLFSTEIYIIPPPPPLPTPYSTMISPVVTVKYGMEMKKKTKTKIGVGSVVKANVGELESITMEGRSRRMRKEVVGCVHSVEGKKKLLVLFEDGQKKEISYSLLVYLSPK